MSRMTLPAREPFNFHSVVSSHGWLQLAPFKWDGNSRTLSYTDQLTNGRVLEDQMRAADRGLQVETAGSLSQAERSEVADKAAWMFGLDQDFSDFYRAVRGEPKLRSARRLARGRVLRSPTFFEDVVKTILTTNTLWAATKRMNLNLIAGYGEPHPGNGTRAFPRPERIAASNQRELRDVVRVGYRAPAIDELAKRVASDELDVEAFKTARLPTLELRKELLKLRGIGPYAAANLLMILGRGDFIPVDTYALKMVSHEWHRGRPVTPKQVEKAFRKWREYKGLAFWFWDWKYDGG